MCIRDRSELDKIIKEEKNINKLKILLANETTKILHGEKASIDAENTALETFQGMGVGKNLPEIKISKSDLMKGISIIDILAIKNILVSKSEARRTIKNNGIKLDGKVILDEKTIINTDSFKDSNTIKISYGKKKHYILKSN